jgi:FtsZ-interacting cell division protein ZipA
MDTGLLVAILVVLILLALLAFFAGRQRRSRRLQDTCGPENERTVEQTGDRRAAEAELRERTERREQFDIVPLEAEARARYIEAWRNTQAQFVDEPVEATREADRLITSVMRDRGYPVDDFEQRAADLSVDHPQVVDDYRAAHAIAAANDRSEASTEDLRQALVHYRSLFEELLEDRHPDRSTTEEAR